MKVTFGKKAEVSNDRPVLRVAKENNAVTLTAIGANPSAMSVSGSKLKYTDAYPDVDIEFTQDNELTKEALILRKAPANAQAAQYKYDIDLEGVTAAKQADNSVLFSDSTGKSVRTHAVFRIPAPFMFDSSGDPERGYSTNITVTLSQLGSGKVRLEVLPDLTWLQDPTRVYPVTLDPTVEQIVYAPDGTTGKDTPLYEANPNTNYGGSTTTNVGRRMGDGLRQDTLLEFPELTLLPQDSIVTRATLSLYATTEDSGVPMEVYAATGPWEEGTATWNTPPPTGSYRYASLSSVVPGWNRFFLNGLTRHWVNGTLSNHGVRIQGYGAATGQNTGFVTSDSTDAAHRLQLVVNYVPATRYGSDENWTFIEQQYDGDTRSAVNISTGNLLFTHQDGMAEMPGFMLDLTHTYNSQDPYGQTPYYQRPGAHFGEAWQFSLDVQLYESGDGSVVYRDGYGGNHVFAKNTVQDGYQTYFQPPGYGYTLKKDVRSTGADPSRIYKLEPDGQDGDTYYFTSQGQLTRRENVWGDYLRFTYDSSDRLTHITEMGTAGRSIVLTYEGPGSPARLSKITEIGGRTSTYGYDSAGNLTSITHDVGTPYQATITLGYGIAHHLLSVTDTNGKTSNIDYKVQYRWDTAGVTWDWIAEGRATAASQSTEQHFRGTGSLKVDISNATTSAVAGIGNYPSPAESWNSIQQELLTYVYVPAAQTVNARLVLKDSRGVLTYGPWWAASGGAVGAWTEIRMPDAHIDPGHKLSKVAMQFGGSSTDPFTGSVWVDHMVVRGVAASLTDSSDPKRTVTSYAYNWDGAQTTISNPNDIAAIGAGAYSYDRLGQLTSENSPVEAYWTPERLDAAQPAEPPSPPQASEAPAPQPEGLEEWYPGGDESSVPPYDAGDSSTAQATPTCPKNAQDNHHPKPCDLIQAPVAAGAPYGKWWRTNGLLYYRNHQGGNSWCSATIVTSKARLDRNGKSLDGPDLRGNQSLVSTAAHCVNPGEPLNAANYTGFWFFPGYVKQNGRVYIAPPGTGWEPVQGGIHFQGWRKRPDNDPQVYGDLRYDFAFMRMKPKKVNNRSRRLHTLLEFQSIGFNYDAKIVYPCGNGACPQARAWTTTGYPWERSADRPFDGNSLWQCRTAYWRAGGLPFPNNFAVSCSMTTGASGGAWYSPWKTDGPSTILSVNSVVMWSNQPDGKHHYIWWGSYFGNAALGVWRGARTNYRNL